MKEMKYKDVLFYFAGIGGWIIVFTTVIWAFFNDYWYAFRINKYGEAWLDLIVIIGIMVFFTYYFIGKVKEI